MLISVGTIFLQGLSCDQSDDEDEDLTRDGQIRDEHLAAKAEAISLYHL